MNDAIYWQLLVKVEELLKDLPFTGFGDVPGIESEHISIRDDALEPRDEGAEEWLDEPPRALYITPSGSIRRGAEAGTNIRDDVVYPILLQFTDREDSRFNRDRLRTHLKWIQDVSRTLHAYDWTAVDFDGGCPIISWTESTRVLDEKLFWRHKFFVRGTIATFITREPRTVT